MSTITQTTENLAYTGVSQADKTQKKDTKTNRYGQTIGKPELSDKAAKYYEQLKKKYSNMNFVLVSEDQKENAKANAAGYANATNMVVLIDEDKIERMAEDEDYRKQYEGIIANAASGLSSLANSIASSGAQVKGFGMQVNDNGTSTFFAVLEKSSAAQKQRIEKKAQEKKTQKKADQKKAEKEEREEKLKKKEDDTITITASSAEELLEKIKDAQGLYGSGVQTEEEKKVGQRIDYSL